MFRTYLTTNDLNVEEPVTLEQALVQLHADPGVEDDNIMRLIRSARQLVEDYTKRSLVRKNVVYIVEGNTMPRISLPRSPVVAIETVTSNGELLLDTDYTFFYEGIPAFIESGKLNGNVRIEYIADSINVIPEPFIDAILLYVSYMYNNREGEREIPKAFYDLIEKYRLHFYG